MTPDDLAAVVARAVREVVGHPWTSADVRLRRGTAVGGDLAAPTAARDAADLGRIAAHVAAASGVISAVPGPAGLVVVTLDDDAWSATTQALVRQPVVAPAPIVLHDGLIDRARYLHARSCALLQGAVDLHLTYDATADLRPALHEARDLVIDLHLWHRAVAGQPTSARGPSTLLDAVVGGVEDFYETHPPLPRGDEKEAPVHPARLLITDASRITLAAALAAAGADAPERC